MSSDKIRLTNRRQFLATIGLGLAGTAALAACGAPAATPTAAPAAPKAAEPTKAPEAAKPTEAPKAEAKPTEAPKPTAAAAAKPAQGTGKLSVWAYQAFTPDGDKQFAANFEEWGKKNSISVEYTPIENAAIPQKLAAAVEGKTPPDVNMFSSPDRALFWAGKSQLIDLTEIWNKTSKQAGGFFESVNGVYVADNKFWAIPFEVDASPMFARLDLMEKATGKKEPPKTMEELLEAGKKITQKPSLYAFGLTLGRVPDTLGGLLNIIWSDGGAYVDKDGKAALQSEGTLTAVKRVQEMWKAGIIPPDATSWDDTGNNNAYQSKQVAFIFNPPSVYDWMVKNDQELLKNSTMAAIPAGKAGSFQGAGSWSWSVFKDSKNIDQAKAAIEATMAPDQMQKVYEKVGGRWFPVYKDLAKHEFWASKPAFNYYAEIVSKGRAISYPAAPTPAVMQAIGEAQTRLVLADMIQGVLIKNQTPEAAIEAAQKTMVDIFKTYGL